MYIHIYTHIHIHIHNTHISNTISTYLYIIGEHELLQILIHKTDLFHFRNGTQFRRS
jgi:hypothetical protein